MTYNRTYTTDLNSHQAKKRSKIKVCPAFNLPRIQNQCEQCSNEQLMTFNNGSRKLMQIMDDKQWKAKIAKIRKKKYDLKKEQAKKKKSTDYNLQYQTDEWLELRERIIQRDNFMCVTCGKKPKVYNVHHLLYQKGRRIWDVPDYYLITLCPGCHIKEHSKRFSIPNKHF